MPKPPRTIKLSSIQLTMLIEEGAVDVEMLRPIIRRTLTAQAVLSRFDKRKCKAKVTEIEPLFYRLTRKDEDPNKAA